MHASNKTSSGSLMGLFRSPRRTTPGLEKRKCLTAFLMALTWATAALAQTTHATGADRGIPATMDEAIARAMEVNPDIITARAKLRLAEAELNAARMETAGKVITLWQERDTQHELLDAAIQRFQQVERLHKIAAVGGEDEKFESARIALINAEANFARSKATLSYLIGQAAPATTTRSETTTNAATLQTMPAPLQIPKGPMVEKVRKALDSATELSFTDTPLSDIMDYLADLHGIVTQVDTKHTGYGLAEMKISLRLRGVPLAAALQAIEDEYPPIRFVVRDYGLLATTRETAQREGYFPAVDFVRLSGGMAPAAAPSKSEAMQPAAGGAEKGGGNSLPRRGT